MYCIKCGKNIPKDSLYCPKCGMQQKGIRPHYSNQPIDEPVKVNIATIVGAILVLIALVFNAIAIFKTSAPLEYYTIWDLFAITGTTISLIGLFGCLEKDEKGKNLAISSIVIGSLSFLYDLLEIIQFLILLYN